MTTSDVHESSSSPLADRFRTYLPVVIDIETGGFNSATDAVLEISAVILNMDKDEKLVINQTFLAGSFLSRVPISKILPLNSPESTPITLFELQGLKRLFFKNMFKLVRDAMKSNGCKRAILVGHNSHFDHGLNAASERNLLKRNPFHLFFFDTASLSGLAYGQTVLARACDAAKIEFDDNQAHSAKYDAEKTAELFCRIVNKWKDLGGWPLQNADKS